MNDPLSLRAYAAWRKNRGLPGGSLEAVRKAIRSGRLVDSVVSIDGVKKIADPEAADREWAANTDPSRNPVGFRFVGEDDEDGEPSAIVLASTRLKQAQAGLAELNLQKRAGTLMDVEDAELAWGEACAMVRTRILGLPNKFKQLCPHLGLEDLATLEDLIREALEELAGEGAPDDEPDEDS